MDADVLREFTTDMRIGKYSPVTIKDRLEVLQRFQTQLGKPLLDATGDDLRDYQKRFATLRPATVNVYSRHLKAFYDWALRRRLIMESPAAEMVIPVVPRGRPHPTSHAELRTIFACTTGHLRMAYLLAAFAGLRRGEICRLHDRDIDSSSGLVTALIHGKGGKERIVPLLDPVVAEMRVYGVRRNCWVLTGSGAAHSPSRLSVESTTHLHGLGLSTTLHSMRGTFATEAGRVTRDPLFVRDLLGHGSVSTTELYVQTNLNDAHLRLAGVASLAEQFMGAPRRVERSA